MKFSLLGIAAGLAAVGTSRSGIWLTLWWPAMSFGAVSAAYFANRPRWLGKRPDGSLGPTRALLLAPYWMLNLAIWHIMRIASREPPAHELEDGVWIGRRVLSSEIMGFRTILDLTAEFAEPRRVRASTQYTSFPVLDGTAPPDEEFQPVIDRIKRAKRPIFIHCAQGHGRTATIAAAWLLARRLGHRIRTARCVRFRPRSKRENAGESADSSRLSCEFGVGMACAWSLVVL